jgi:hypothetical protein
MSRHFHVRIQSSCLTAPFFPGLQGARAFIDREHSHLVTASVGAASQSRALRTHHRHRPRAATAGQEMEKGAKPACSPVQLFKNGMCRRRIVRYFK